MRDTVHKDKITSKVVKVIGFGSPNGVDEDEFSESNAAVLIIDMSDKIARGDLSSGSSEDWLLTKE